MLSLHLPQLQALFRIRVSSKLFLSAFWIPRNWQQPVITTISLLNTARVPRALLLKIIFKHQCSFWIMKTKRFSENRSFQLFRSSFAKPQCHQLISHNHECLQGLPLFFHIFSMISPLHYFTDLPLIKINGCLS